MLGRPPRGIGGSEMWLKFIRIFCIFFILNLIADIMVDGKIGQNNFQNQAAHQHQVQDGGSKICLNFHAVVVPAKDIPFSSWSYYIDSRIKTVSYYFRFITGYGSGGLPRSSSA
jgi:hypothetical protein